MTKNLIIKNSQILPWEDTDAYERLIASLLEEYDPAGPTERHLVEELAGIMWRRERIVMAESALHQYGLSRTLKSFSNTSEHAAAPVGGKPMIDVSDAMGLSQNESTEQLSAAIEDREMTEKAQQLASEGQYEDAVQALREDTREWWLELLADGEDNSGRKLEATSESLLDWLKLEAMPVVSKTEFGLTHVDTVRAQAYGESLIPDKFNELAKWEAHLDRRLERTLTLLMKLRNTRLNAAPA